MNIDLLKNNKGKISLRQKVVNAQKKSKTYMSRNILNKTTVSNIRTNHGSMTIHPYELVFEILKHHIVVIFYPWMKSLGNILILFSFATRRLFSSWDFLWSLPVAAFFVLR